MAANYTLNSPGRPRLAGSVTKDDGAILYFYPRPSKRVKVGNLDEAFMALNHSDAETVLRGLLPQTFCQEADDHGFSLIECMEEAKILLPVLDGSSESLVSDVKIAGILASVAPDMDPYLMLVHMRMLLKARGRYAVRILREYEESFGRDGEDGRGYIRLSDPAVQNTLP